MLNDLLRYRRYIVQNAFREMRHRYAGTGMGWVWHVVSPVCQIAVYWFVFSRIMPVKFGSDGGGTGGGAGMFAVYLCCGVLPWTAFAEALSRGTAAFQEHAGALKRVAIPGSVFVATAVVTATLQLMISLVLLVVFALAMGVPAAWTWLLLPVVGVLWQLMAFGMALGLGTLNVFFRDIAQMLMVFLQIWFWSLPVVYVEGILPAGYRAWLICNPPYSFLTGMRTLLEGHVPAGAMWGGMAGWIFLALVMGGMVFSRLEGEARDLL